MTTGPCGVTPEIERKGTSFLRHMQPKLLPKYDKIKKNEDFLHFL